MKRILLVFCLILFGAKLFAGVALDVPPEQVIKTTLVINSIVGSVGATKLGFQDIVILDGVHIEQQDAFGQVKSIAASDSSATKIGICSLAGFSAGWGVDTARYEEYIPVDSGVVMEYASSRGSATFFLTQSNRGIDRIACINNKIQPPPASVKMPTPHFFTFDLSAEKVERLILPTGESYIRIVNPQINLSEPFFGANRIVFDSGAGAPSCRVFGYNNDFQIQGITTYAKGTGGDLFYGGNKNAWVATSGPNYYSVLTCRP